LKIGPNLQSLRTRDVHNPKNSNPVRVMQWLGSGPDQKPGQLFKIL